MGWSEGLGVGMAQQHTSVCRYFPLRTGNVTICSLSFWPNILVSLSLSLCSFCEVFVGGAVRVVLALVLAPECPQPPVWVFSPCPCPGPFFVRPLSTPLSLSIIAAHNLPMLLECLMRVLVGTSLAKDMPYLIQFAHRLPDIKPFTCSPSSRVFVTLNFTHRKKLITFIFLSN